MTTPHEASRQALEEAASNCPNCNHYAFCKTFDKKADADARHCLHYAPQPAAPAQAAPIIAARYRNGQGRWTYTDTNIGGIEADGWREVVYLCDANAAPQPAAPVALQPLTDGLLNEKARLHVQQGYSWRGFWSEHTELCAQLGETYYRRGWRECEKFNGIKQPGSETA